MKRAVREAWNPREREVEVFSRICEHGPMTKQLFDGATRDEAVPSFGLGLTSLTKVMKTRKGGHVDISHGFAKGEKVEGELDILITRRHESAVRPKESAEDARSGRRPRSARPSNAARPIAWRGASITASRPSATAPP
jgi:hypothetical protein